MENGAPATEVLPSGTVSFYAPGDVIAAIKRLNKTRGDQSRWFLALAKPALQASGALEITEEEAALQDFKEAVAVVGPKTVRAKLAEIACSAANTEGGQ
jgi:hypothetical protein